MTTKLHISSATRFIVAMFRIVAGIEDNFGRTLIQMLEKQYPGQKITKYTGTALGNKMIAIARGQLQGNFDRAYDAVQDYLTYLSTGVGPTDSEIKVDADGFVLDPYGKPKLTKKGEKVRPEDLRGKTFGQQWNFAKDFEKIEDALGAALRNLKTRAMSYSKTSKNRSKYMGGIDDEFGKRGEDGGAPSGGEAFIPNKSGFLAEALDDQISIQNFVNVIQDSIPDLEESLTPDCRKLFDVIFNDDNGGFGSDISQNMNQASALKAKYPELWEKNEKRWSGFVGGLRKKLLDEIWDFVNNDLADYEYDILKDEFFKDASPSAIREGERSKGNEKAEYQQGLDERKLSAALWRKENGSMKDDDERVINQLSKKLKDQGIDVSKIPLVEAPSIKTWKIQKTSSSKIMDIAYRIVGMV